jgi:hypothetical protein
MMNATMFQLGKYASSILYTCGRHAQGIYTVQCHDIVHVFEMLTTSLVAPLYYGKAVEIIMSPPPGFLDQVPA